MLLTKSRKTVIDGISEKCIQPNAVDITLAKVFVMSGQLILSEDKRVQRDMTQVFHDPRGMFVIEPGHAYQIEFEQTINVAEGEAGFIIGRSTLVRNGLFITSGLYDSGYNGTFGAVLHNFGDTALIAKGTRVAQFLSVAAETLHLYEGIYNDSSKLS